MTAPGGSGGAEFSAAILDALGKHDAAETLRWGPTPPELDERDALASELEHAVDMLAQLEAMLCKRCTAKWKAGQ